MTFSTPRSRTLPKMAMLSASVPPLVKTISPGAQFSKPEIFRRACSTAARVVRPKEWMALGLPWCSRMYGR